MSSKLAIPESIGSIVSVNNGWVYSDNKSPIKSCSVSEKNSFYALKQEKIKRINKVSKIIQKLNSPKIDKETYAEIHSILSEE